MGGGHVDAAINRKVLRYDMNAETAVVYGYSTVDAKGYTSCEHNISRVAGAAVDGDGSVDSIIALQYITNRKEAAPRLLSNPGPAHASSVGFFNQTTRLFMRRSGAGWGVG